MTYTADQKKTIESLMEQGLFDQAQAAARMFAAQNQSQQQGQQQPKG